LDIQRPPTDVARYRRRAPFSDLFGDWRTPFSFAPPVQKVGAMINKLAVLSLLLCATLAADDSQVLLITPKGMFVVTFDADGNSTKKPLEESFKHVIRVGTPTPPTDPTDPPPTDPILTPAEKKIADMTREAIDNGGNPTTAAALGAVYTAVATSLESGALSVDNALEAVRMGSDLVVRRQSDGAKWTPWRKDVSDTLAALEEDGLLSTKAQFVSTFRQIANGINSVVGFNGDLKSPGSAAGADFGIDINRLIQLIELIMEILKTFFGK
jgi:hypothetical protein